MSRSPARLFEVVHEPLPVTFFSTTAHAARDVDGDGHLDVIRAVNSRGVEVLLGNGDGAFLDLSQVLLPETPAAASPLVTCVSLGDLDGSGGPDLYLTLVGSQDRLFINLGNGRFQDASAQLPPAVSTGLTYLADVDQNGALDVLKWGIGGQPPQQLRNDGSGTFADTTTGNMPNISSLQDVAMGDVDGDGDQDALAARGQLNELYLADNTGSFALATGNLPPDLRDTLLVELGDVDGDGDLDAVLSNVPTFTPEELQLYRNDGTGVFNNVSGTFSFFIFAEQHLYLQDADTDGDLDIFIPGVLLNDGTGSFPTALAGPGGDTTFVDLLFGDFDEDGDADVLVPGPGLDELQLNDGSAGFTSASAALFPTLAFDTTDMQFGDLDGNGTPDLYVGSWADEYYLNLGPGRFSRRSLPFGFILPDTTGVALSDLDADGDLDAVLSSSNRSGVLYENQGDGSFLDNPAFPASSTPALAVGTGDFDDNGLADVLFGTTSGFEPLLYRNDGANTFVDISGNLPSEPGSSTAVAIADADGDGDLDTALGLQDGQNRLLINNGSALFSAATSWSTPPSDRTRALCWSDVDADGDLDLIVANVEGLAGAAPTQRLYLNDGSGSLNERPGALPTGSKEAVDIFAGDVDEDGHVDLVLASTPSTIFLRGRGTGDFEDLSGVLPPGLSSRIVAGSDIDGDADIDLVVDGRFLSNQLRHVHWTTAPREGRPLRLRHAGEPGTPWLLYVSSGLSAVPLPPFGTSYLDPAGGIALGSGTLDRTGRSDTTIPFVNLPSLTGTFLYVQSLVGTPLRFTNLETLDFQAP